MEEEEGEYFGTLDEYLKSRAARFEQEGGNQSTLGEILYETQRLQRERVSEAERNLIYGEGTTQQQVDEALQGVPEQNTERTRQQIREIQRLSGLIHENTHRGVTTPAEVSGEEMELRINPVAVEARMRELKFDFGLKKKPKPFEQLTFGLD